MRRKFWLILSLAAVTLLVVSLGGLPFQKQIHAANDWAIQIMNGHPLPGALVFFLFSALSAMLAFASSTVLVPSAISAWGKPVTFLLLWGGWIAGAIAAYSIGKFVGPRLLTRRHQEKLEEYRAFVSEQIRFWAVLLFCFAVPSEVPGYLLGGMRYPFRKFILAMGLVEAVVALGVVIAGEDLITSEFSSLFLVLGALAAITLTAGLLLRAFKAPP